VLAFVGANDQAGGVTAKFSQLILLLANNIETLARVVTVVLVGKALTGLIAIFVRLGALLRGNPFLFLIQAIGLAVGALVGFGDKILVTSDGVTTLQDVVVSAWNNIVEAFKRGDFQLAIFVASVSGVLIAMTSLAPAINRVLGLVGALSTALARNPLVLIAAGAAAASVGVALLVKELDKLNARQRKAAEIQTEGDNLRQLGIDIERRRDEVARLEKVLVARSKSGVETDVAAVETLNRKLLTASQELLRLQEQRDQSIGKINTLSNQFDDLPGFKQKGQEIGDEIAAGVEASGLTGLFDKILDDAAKRANERAAQQAAPTNPLLTDRGAAADPAVLATRLTQLEEENFLLERTAGLTADLTKAEQIELALGVSLNKDQQNRLRLLVVTNEQYKRRKALLDEIQGPQQRLVDGEKQLTFLFDTGAITAEQYNSKLRDLARDAALAEKTVGGNLKAAIIDLQAELTTASIATDVFTSGFNTAADALTEFITRGKADIKEFANAFLADITRIIVRLLLLQLIEAGTAAFGGTAGVGAIAARAGGGPVQANRPYLVGEEGPELFVPNGNGNIIPADRTAAALTPSRPRETIAAQGQQGGGDVTVVNSLDPQVALASMDTPQGHRVVINAISANKGQVKRMLA
jgi:hypothetical protein